MRLRVLLLGVCVASAAHAQNPAVTINVDAAANRHAISPDIYGAAGADAATIDDLNITLNRWGGNATSRHNWQINTTNRAADWFFENVPDPVASNTPGAAADAFISSTRTAGAQPVITIPMLEWLPKARDYDCSFPSSRFAAQQTFAPDRPACGNGRDLAGTRIFNAVKTDASVQVNSLFQQAWIQHLVQTWGSANAGGVRYYGLDNEPALWSYSHWDVHPSGSTYVEVRDKMIDFGTRIKAADPGALLLGPEEWGWQGYFYSGYDAENGFGADRNNHGGTPYVVWLLQQLYAHQQNTGTRLLDYLTVHYYPQSGEFDAEDPVTPELQALRNRSTRSLWDPAYQDESWMKWIEGGIIRLIPRLKEWTATHYPGTKTGLTEYNWGAENHMNGATAQADVMGILGREGVDMAIRWTAPVAGTPVYQAFKMYRNYDGNDSTFGEVSVSASGPNPDSVAAFAAVRRRDNALTIMIVNKVAPGTTQATVNLASHFAMAPAQRWQLAGNVITRPDDVSFAGNSATITLPEQSVTLLVVPGPAPAPFEMHGDLNGDNRDDIVVRDAAGNVGVNFMNGATITGGGFIEWSGAYNVAGLGDLNGDGRSDIVLSSSTGNVGAWLMNGSAIASGGLIGSPGEYSVAGVADFNGDGRADILLRDSLGNLGMWIMNGTTIVSGALVGSPGAYTVAAVADFSGDGKADILLRDSLGNLGMWIMNGSTITAGALVGSPGAYFVAGAADFNADAKADIVLRDAIGNIGLWFMNGATITAGALVGSPGGYGVNTLGDYDGNGRADMLLRSTESGDIGMWLMNGAAISSGHFVAPVPPTSIVY